MSHVTCHMSRVMCHMSCVTCHMSHVIFFLDKAVKLIGGGSGGSTPTSFYMLQDIKLSASTKIDLFHKFQESPGH